MNAFSREGALLDGLHPPLRDAPGGRGVSLARSFWDPDNLNLLGRTKEAEALLEKLIALRNDVGLLSEECDPRHERMLGNFPQAFSHVGLSNSCASLRGRGPAHDRHGAIVP